MSWAIGAALVMRISIPRIILINPAHPMTSTAALVVAQIGCLLLPSLLGWAETPIEAAA